MTFVDLLFLISNAFCFITAGVILFKINTNRIFGVYVLVAYLILNGITNGFYLLIQYKYLSYVPVLYKMPAPLTFLIGPASYLYLRSTLYSESRFKKSDWIHFIPFAVFLVNYLPFYFMPLADKNELVQRVVEDFSLVYLNQDGMLPEQINIIARALTSIVYLIAQGLLIKKFYKKNTLKTPHFLKIKSWVTIFFRAQIGYWSTLLVIYIINGLVAYFGEGLVPDIITNGTLILMSIFFFVLSAYLLMNPNAMLGLNLALSVDQKSKTPATYHDKIFEELDHIVRSEKLFLNPSLNLSTLSISTKISQRNISIALSDQSYDNINEYINKLRVEEVKEKLITQDLQNFSIEAIAENCGFNSKATFYRVFKKIFEVTPTEYLNQLKS